MLNLSRQMRHVMRTATGRLIFDKEMNNGQTIPIHNLKVKLYDHDTLSSNDLLEVGYTDLDGYFEIKYDDDKAGYNDRPDLELALYTKVPVYKKGQVVEKELAVPGFKSHRQSNVNYDYDFGEVEVKFWEYRPEEDSYTPRLLIDPKRGFPLAQKQRWERNQVINMCAVVQTKNRLTGFPPNETMEMEARGENPRSDEFLVYLATNGFYPCMFKKTDDGRYFVEFSWDGLQQNGKRYAPDTTAYFNVDGEGKLSLHSIDVTERTGYVAPHDALKAPTKTYTAANCADTPGLWDNVKKLWRINYFFFGEAYGHIGNFHYNVEQFILPFMRHVRKNPLYELLFPHFYGTVSINKEADPLMTDPEGLVPATSAATPEAVARATRQAFGQNNWHGWSPRKPLHKEHRFAFIQQKYWDILDQYVNEYFQKNEEGIIENWIEVKRMSDELIKRAVPFFEDKHEGLYTDSNEVNKTSSPHPEVNGVKVALTPITEDEVITEANKAENLANLKQMCKYLLMYTTVKHCWTNDLQNEIGGQPDFCSFGVDFNILKPENVARDPIDPEIVAWLIRSSWFVVAQKWGYIMKDEARDMNPRLKELLEENRETFKKWDYDIDNIRNCINT
eukprot:TRINITY_DN458_c0_g5_i1.p1 TRINITY_DN458_c0_g5~~TRINITY_DN458_c0_g5_i1.p1  ORF type:complete len:636 (+),score=193.31 TRINITY_DN458_c0_g5_i1:59-1909(+)